MILSWNFRGLNKASRHSEIRSHLSKLNCALVALLETRVKKDKADRIRRKMGKWEVIDNYYCSP